MKNGFPSDDAMSLQQLAGYAGGMNLDFWYNNQFVQNETIHQQASVNSPLTTFHLEHSPMLPGTLAATICEGNVAIYTLVALASGKVNCTPIGEQDLSVVEAAINDLTSTLSIVWNNNVSNMKIVASYEWNIEQQAPALPAYNLSPNECLWDKIEKQNKETVEEELISLRQQLAAEKHLNEQMEAKVYNEFEDKLKDMKEYFTTKIDQFLRQYDLNSEEDRNYIKSKKSCEIFDEAVNPKV